MLKETALSAAKLVEDRRPIQGPLTLEHFRKDGTNLGCYDRKTRNQWAVVDSHLHLRPFGGPPVEFENMVAWLQRAGTLFVNGYGIGQRLPTASACTYYGDCPGTEVTPSMKNDFMNGQNLLDSQKLLSTVMGPYITLSVSFPDLHNPKGITKGMKLLDKEFPDMFRWMGELNVVKQALFNNSQGFPIEIETVKDWAPFMEVLRTRDVVVALHSDIGSDAEPTKYLDLMDAILETYPHNKVAWLHLGGLSKQLNPLPPALIERPMRVDAHAQILRERLRRFPNLTVDLAWDVLYDEVWAFPEKMQVYVDLINEFPTRFLPGTDFVAAVAKPEEEYMSELNKTSVIYQHVSDEAFRNIALGENYFKLLRASFTAPPVC